MERQIKHPEAKSVGWALIHAARLHRARMSDKLTNLGLFAGQEALFQALAASGAMTIGELATMLRIRPPTVSKMVTRLATVNLVERHPDGSDARIVRVRLTGQGQRMAATIDRLWDEVEAEMLESFDLKDHKRLRKMLRKVVKNLAVVTDSDLQGLDDPDDVLAEERLPAI